MLDGVSIDLEREKEHKMTLKKGDRVRVKESVIVYHNPKNKKKPFDLKGMEGEIAEIIEEPITATLPILVQFNPKFKAHLKENEIEIIS